jgi:hypothetical protein
MAVDAVVSRKLKSLQEELSASQRERLAAPAAARSATAAAGEPVGQRPAGSSTSGDHPHLRSPLRCSSRWPPEQRAFRPS